MNPYIETTIPRGMTAKEYRFRNVRNRAIKPSLKRRLRTRKVRNAAR